MALTKDKLTIPSLLNRVTTLEKNPVAVTGTSGDVSAASYTAAKSVVDDTTNLVTILGLGTFERTSETVTGASSGSPQSANQHDGLFNIVFEVSSGVFKLFRRATNRVRIDAGLFNINAANSGDKNRINMALALAFTAATGAELVFAEADTIVFSVANPASNDQIAIDCPENSHIRILSQCTIEFDAEPGDGNNHILFNMRSNSSIRGGGTIQGTYTSALEGEITANCFMPGNILIRTNNVGAGSALGATPYSNIIFEDFAVKGSYNESMRIITPTDNVIIRNITFGESFSHLDIFGNQGNFDPGTDVTTLPLNKNIKVLGCKFGYSHHTNPNVSGNTGGTYNGQSYPAGGNHITTSGGVHGLIIRDCEQTGACGRRGLEGFPLSPTSDDDYTLEEGIYYSIAYLEFSNNRWTQAAVERNLTLQCYRSNFFGNEIVDHTHTVEAGLVESNFYDNIVRAYGCFDFLKGTLTGSQIATINKRNGDDCDIYNNVFIMGLESAGTTGRAATLVADMVRNLNFHHNTIHYWGYTPYALADIFASSEVKLNDNTIYMHTPSGSNTNAIAKLDTIRNLEVDRNKIIFTQDYGKTTTTGLIQFINVDNYSFDDNEFDVRNTDALAHADFNILYLGDGASPALKRVVFSADGTSTTETDITMLDTPPGSPVTNAAYLIVDYPTPSGAWSGKAGQIATWNGSAWTYQFPEGFEWRIKDSNSIISNASSFFDTTYRSDNALDREKELSGYVKDNKVYVHGYMLRNGSIKRNKLRQNILNTTLPVRTYNLCLLRDNALIQGLEWEDNNFLIRRDGTKLAVSQYGTMPFHQRVKLPNRSITAIPGQVKTINNIIAEVPATALGHNRFYSLIDGNWIAFGQIGYRTNAGSPVSSVTPYYAGETLFDSANSKWYRSYGTSNSQWALQGG